MWDYRIRGYNYFDYALQPGVSIRLFADSELSKLIYIYNFEYQERRFINTFLQPGDIFIDVGANIGLFTVIAALCVGKAGKVYAFEPGSRTFQYLLANVRLNEFENTHIYNIALSSHSGKLDLHVSLEGFDAWNSFGQPTQGQVFTVEDVDTITWDQFAQEHDLVGKVTMMKIDVEGWENHVLTGGTETLSRSDAPTLQVEFTEMNAQLAGTSCKNLYNQLLNLGYQMFTYDLKTNTLCPDILRDVYPYMNLIATKRPEFVYARLRERSQ
jgi:FkbM family methyltransferase